MPVLEDRLSRFEMQMVHVEDALATLRMDLDMQRAKLLETPVTEHGSIDGGAKGSGDHDVLSALSAIYNEMEAIRCQHRTALASSAVRQEEHARLERSVASLEARFAATAAHGSTLGKPRANTTSIVELQKQHRLDISNSLIPTLRAEIALARQEAATAQEVCTRRMGAQESQRDLNHDIRNMLEREAERRSQDLEHRADMRKQLDMERQTHLEFQKACEAQHGALIQAVEAERDSRLRSHGDLFQALQAERSARSQSITSVTADVGKLAEALNAEVSSQRKDIQDIRQCLESTVPKLINDREPETSAAKEGAQPLSQASKCAVEISQSKPTSSSHDATDSSTGWWW